MNTLNELMEAQQGKCHYCGCQMVRTTGPQQPNTATIEHLKDKWDSPKHIKDERSENLVAACLHCNNTRGAVRNKAARKYYQEIIKQKKLSIQSASTSSSRLFKMFGPVPQEVLLQC